MKRISLESHLRKLALSWASAGLVLTLTLSFSVFMMLVVKDSEGNLRNLTRSVVASHRTDLLSGDVRAVELQLQKQFDLTEGESLLFLDADKKPWVADLRTSKTRPCKADSGFCRDWRQSTIWTYQPIFFDTEEKNVWGYLYVEKGLRPNWTLIFSVVLAIVFGMVFQGFGFYFNLSRAVRTVGGTLSLWAERLSADPKDMGAARGAPFQELEGIEGALSGLKSEIIALEETARSQGALTTLRGVGHDILNPVSRMKRILGLLDMKSQKGVLPDPELLVGLASNLKRLSSYAEQLKHIYKSRQNGARDSAPVVDVSAEVVALTTELSFDSEAIDRAIRIEVCTDKGCGVRISRPALARIVENLVGNAIQASPDGSTVEVSVKCDVATVQLAISDSGCGIAPEHEAKIFDPGFTTKMNKGTGLGLFVVKELCEQFGGSVSVQSRVQSGTTFIIKFPWSNIEVSHGIQAALG